MIRNLLIACSLALLAWPAHSFAQNSASDVRQATVVSENAPRESYVPGTDIRTFEQKVRLRMSETGEEVDARNDYSALSVGDRVFVSQGEDGVWRVFDVDRRLPVTVFAFLFAGAILLVGRGRGFRALVSLCASLCVIFFGLIPLLLNGYSPTLTIIILATVLLAIVMYTTHGWSWSTHAAFFSTALATTLAVFLSTLAVSISHLTGFSDDAAIMLNASTSGSIDLAALLIGAMVIGAIGVLDDIAITQIAAVGEIRAAKQSLSPRDVFSRAMRIGREHVGALANTLALAYASVSLPLLLLFTQLESPVWMLLNQEVFAVEIIRLSIGGIALAATVPLSTLFGVLAAFTKDFDHHAMHSHT